MIRSYFYKALSLSCIAGLTASLLVMSQENTTHPGKAKLHPTDIGFYPPLETTLMLDNAKSTKEPATKKAEATKITVLAFKNMHIIGVREGSTQQETIWLGAMPYEDKIKILEAFPTIWNTPELRENLARKFDAPRPLTREEERNKYVAEKEEALQRNKNANAAAAAEARFHQENKTYSNLAEHLQMLASPDLMPKLHELEFAQKEYESKYGQLGSWYAIYTDKAVNHVLWWTLIPKIKMKSPTEAESVSLRPDFEKMGIRALKQTPNGCQLYSGYYFANYMIQKDGGKPITFPQFEAAVVDAAFKNLGHKPDPKKSGFAMRDITRAIATLHGKKLNAALPHGPLPFEVIASFAEQSLREGVPVPIVGPTLNGSMTYFHAALLVGFRHEPGQKTIYEYIDTQGENTNLKNQKTDKGYFEADRFGIDALLWFE